MVDQNNPYHMVIARGRVVEQTKKGAEEHIDKLAKNTSALINIHLGSVHLMKRGL